MLHWTKIKKVNHGNKIFSFGVFLQVALGLTTSQISTGINPALSYTQSQGIPDTESPVPVINLKDGTRLAGDDAPKRKDLEKWLKEHPGYVEDLGAFIPVGDTLQILVIYFYDLSHL